MIKVSVTDVKNKFQDVINERITRDEADKWAYSIIKMSEADGVQYIPKEKKEFIWECLMYLYGIDLQESPTQYLHSLENIQEAFLKYFPEAVL